MKAMMTVAIALKQLPTFQTLITSHIQDIQVLIVLLNFDYVQILTTTIRRLVQRKQFEMFEEHVKMLICLPYLQACDNIVIKPSQTDSHTKQQ